MDKSTAATLLFMVSFFQIALCQHAGKYSLQCYSCTFDQPCTESPSSVVTCKEGEQCGFIKGNSDYKIHQSIDRMGCIPAKKCSSNDNITHPSGPYRVTYSCCNTNYCNNGISGVSHSSPTHLVLLFVATLSVILFTFLS